MMQRLWISLMAAALLSGCSHMAKFKAPALKTSQASKVGFKDGVKLGAGFKRWKALNRFQWLDKNDDGLMDYDEYLRAADNQPNMWVKASKANAHIPDYIKSEFRRADLNADSALSPEEFLSAEGGVKALR